MSDPEAIRELEEQLAHYKKRLGELRKHEAELLEDIASKGFQAATNRAHLHNEMEMLEDSIRKSEEMLAMARR